MNENVLRIFYAPPGWGKTAAVVSIGIQYMYGDNAIIALQQAYSEVTSLRAKGFNVSYPKSNHLVYVSDNCSIDVTSPDFGHRRSLVLYPDRLGIATKRFKPQFVYRGSTLIIDELPDYADSRSWKIFGRSRCRYFAKCRKHGLTILATCQHPDQVDKRIRIHAMITEVRNIEFIKNDKNEVIQTVWQFNNWACYSDWVKGIEPTQETHRYNGDIRKAYNTYEGEDEFYVGLDIADFSCEYSERKEKSLEDIKKLEDRIDSLLIDEEGGHAIA